MNDPIFGHDQGATLNGRPIDGVLANHGQHDLSLPITHRIARDSTRSRLPWDLFLVLDLCGSPIRRLCDCLIGQRYNHHPGFG